MEKIKEEFYMKTSFGFYIKVGRKYFYSAIDRLDMCGKKYEHKIVKNTHFLN